MTCYKTRERVNNTKFQAYKIINWQHYEGNYSKTLDSLQASDPSGLVKVNTAAGSETVLQLYVNAFHKNISQFSSKFSNSMLQILASVFQICCFSELSPSTGFSTDVLWGSSSSKNNFVNKLDDPNAIPTLGSKINADLPSSVHGFVTANTLLDSTSFRCFKDTSDSKHHEENVIPDSKSFSWNKPKHIKINFNKENLVLSEDGAAVKLVESSEISNSKRLEFSVVVKVFGKELPPNVVAWELRRQWAKFGQFHFTSLGKGWYLCSFKCLEAFEGVLAGGPWYVNQHIVGLDRWSTDFSPTSMKGLSSPIWIRMPHLPLQCWDEDNVAISASMIGEPLMLDGNMFLWGKREFARVCVRLELDKPLPLGVWVDGIAGRFFQKVEYERISTFCYNCGMVGHDKSVCTKGRAVEPGQDKVLNASDRSYHEKSYGPWILVKHKKCSTRFGRVRSSTATHPEGNLLKANADNLAANEVVLDHHSVENVQFAEKVVENGDAVLESCSRKSEDSRDKVSKEFLNNSKPSNTSVENKFDVLGDLIGDDNMVNSEDFTMEKTDLNNVIVGSGSPEKLLEEEENIVDRVVMIFKIRFYLKFLIRGARKKKASRYLKEIVRDHGALFVGLVETKIDSLDKFELKQMMGDNWDFFIYPSNGLSGGILTCWRSDLVSFSVIQASSQVVVGELDCGVEGVWLIATVYGDNDCYIKEKLWKSLGNPSFGKLMFIVGGDFKCILSQDEKKGGKKFAFKKGALDMLAFMRNFDFHEVQATGPRFTWCNNKKGLARILEKLDRCIINAKALTKPNKLVVKHLARVASDHCPLLVKIFSNNFHKNRELRFEDVWLSYRASWFIVKSSWQKDMVGNEAEILNKKLRRSLKALYFWSKAKQGELNNHKEKLKVDILQLQEEEATSDCFSELRIVNELIYLGVKLALRRLVVADFNKIIERTSNRLNVWGNEFISTVGRLQLVNSTCLAIPIFSATHSLIPTRVLDVIEKLCRDYIWCKGNGSKGMHFVAWNVLCRPKNKGGRVLMSIVDKCGPLRARLAWNFINNPDSLAHKLIAAKHGLDLWENQDRCNMSTAWKILKVGATHLWPFVRRRISSGENINTVNDIWLLNRNLSSWPTYVAQMDESSNLLSDLIKSICSIKIYSNQDKMELMYKCSGRSLSSIIWDSSFTELCEDLVWCKMKKLRLRPRVEFFWWKLRLNAIPSNTFLQQRKLVDCSDCPRCSGSLEDVDHISVKCIKIHSTLKFLAGWGCNLPSFNDFSKCIKCIITLATSNPFIGNLYCTVVFLCWKSRNNLSHGGRDDSSLVLATNAFCMAVASFNCNLSLENWNANQLRLSNISWCPPPPRWIKANVDAAISINNKAGIGVIFRDYKGRFLYAFGRSLLHWDIAQVEVLSILAVGDIIKDWMTQADGIIIESDNSNVIRFFIDIFNNNYLDKEGILNPKDLDFIQNFRLIHFNFAVRECNRLADFCASLALLSDFIWDDISSNNVPPSFLNLLKEECLCN
ncbi:hypothetical protein M5K25_022310 [Dendrobium thyrsiflorum]|uniref:CCHC-type domain-containing protein n=1 Tax=Dendrobium thyrsiflorum TaxID=117978 RepID=A0ABD0U5W8_DENTH